jgi:hypothetical protein
MGGRAIQNEGGIESCRKLPRSYLLKSIQQEIDVSSLPQQWI